MAEKKKSPLEGIGRFFGMDGKPISMEAWSKMMDVKVGEESSRRVAYTKLSKSANVSTVLLGLEHGTDKRGRPLIFETMSFSDGDEDLCWRYSTLEGAKRGHAKMVALLRKQMEKRSVAGELRRVPRPRITDDR